MPLYKEISITGGLLLLWKITENVDELLKQIGNIDIHKFEKIKNEKRQKEWLAVRLLLKHANCSAIEVAYNDKKQPVINHPTYKQVSISHSNQIAGILLHESQIVGLDIENIQRDFTKVENKYLSQYEKELVHEIENGHALFWCAKEAVYKAAGIAGIHFAKQIMLDKPSGNKLQAKLLLEKRTHKYLLNFIQLEKQLVVYLTDNQNN